MSDANANTGALEDATLSIGLEAGSSFEITLPAGAGSFSADVQMLNYQPIAVERALFGTPGGSSGRPARM